MPNSRSQYRIRRFMAVTMDVQPEGLNLSCWITTIDFWAGQRVSYPHSYTYDNSDCRWMICSSSELTSKLIVAIGEYAQKICDEQIKINANRKLANR